VAPSLFRRADGPALSELYQVNGANLFSLVDGDDQLLGEVRFAPPEPAYYHALEAGGAPDPLFERLAEAFQRVPPFSGRPEMGPPQWSLRRWDAEGSHTVDDPARRRQMAERLAAAWRRFVPDELTPAEEGREWPPHDGGTG
jgi:hypothetical protein